MKKFVSVFLALLMCAAAFAGAGIIANGLQGDTNEDGAIDNKDVVTLFRYVSGVNKVDDESLYDYNGDGVADNKDVVALFRAVSTGSGGDTTETEEPEEFVVVPDKEAELSIPRVFGDHMVIQRDEDIKVWGTSNRDGAKIRGTFMGEEARGQVKDGKWEIVFSSKDATFDPQTLTVEDSCGNVVNITDILVGDVWIIGGQSNAEATIQDLPSLYSAMEIDANKPLRLFHQGAKYVMDNRALAAEPCEDIINLNWKWRKSNKQGASMITVLGWFVGDSLLKDAGTPIGIISIAASGAKINELMPKELANKFGYKFGGEVGPAEFYNALANPFIKMKFKGMVFFQGESESFNGAIPTAANYARDFEALMTELRSRWGFDFPIYNVQLTDYTYTSTLEKVDGNVNYGYIPNVGYVRTQQYTAYKNMSGVRLIPSYDLGADEGEPNFLHSKYKDLLAYRITDLIAAEIYGKGSVEDALAPEPETITVTGTSGSSKTVEIKFKHVGKGLKSTSGSNEFTGLAYGTSSTPSAAVAVNGKIISADTVQITVPSTAKYIGYACMNHIAKSDVILVSSNGVPALAFYLKLK